jgi:magnesium transporter
LDGQHLAGLVRLEHVLAADPATAMSSIMDSEPPAVGPGIDQERAAWRMVLHWESSLAVIDEEGRFRGLIPPKSHARGTARRA